MKQISGRFQSSEEARRCLWLFDSGGTTGEILDLDGGASCLRVQIAADDSERIAAIMRDSGASDVEIADAVKSSETIAGS